MTIIDGFYWFIPHREDDEPMKVVHVDHDGVWRPGSELDDSIEEMLEKGVLIGPIKPPTKQKVLKARLQRALMKVATS